ncbi:hypothetical protein K1X76_12540 [bacterium]|nr:hypothetical protein [bacterium]
MTQSNTIDAERTIFDNNYKPILDALDSVRLAQKNILNLLIAHKDKIEAGKIVTFQRNGFQISESIDSTLSKEFSSFINNATIAYRETQKITKYFGVDIGFLYQKDSQFNKGIENLVNQKNYELANYLKQVRLIWAQNLVDSRNAQEHSGWTFPNMQYILGASKLAVQEPTFDQKPLSKYLPFISNHLLNFVEDLITYSFKQALLSPMIIVEIPLTERNPDIPMRFRVYLENQGIPKWEMSFSSIF